MSHKNNTENNQGSRIAILLSNDVEVCKWIVNPPFAIYGEII